MTRTEKRRALVVAACALSVVGWSVGCGDKQEQAEPDEVSAETQADPSSEDLPPEPSNQVAEQLARTRVHLDLAALTHLADVHHHGLYIDFGTAARMHYTMGRWRNGLLSDVAADGRDFTRMGTDARAWFQRDEAGPLTLRLRGRPIGSRSIVVYLNGQRAGQIDFSGQGVQEHDVTIDPALVRAGENALMLRASETRTVQGEAVAAEIDSIWIFEGSVPQGELTPPLYSQLVRPLEVGGQRRDAVVVRAPSAVRWYAELPEGARLSFAIGASGGESSGRARVTVTPEGGEPAHVFEGALSPRWSDQLVDLSRFAGEVVRLEFAVEGDANEVGIAGPAVVVPLPEEPLAERRANSVIVLLIDTLRASKLRTYNPQSRVETPTLDAFASEGAVFERAQSPENWTKPSVASILTSLTPMTHNTKEDGSSLSPSALMVSEVFQQNGFATASFIANGYVSDRYGFRQGWDHYTNYIREERNTEARNVFREAIEWIEAHCDQRFFAYIHTIDPHVPYDPPEDLLRMYDPADYTGPLRPRRTGLQLGDVKAGRLELTARDRQRLEALHDGEITYHDREMARFVERLRELGIYDDVIFVVVSDHGEEFYEHGSFGHGHSVYQELLHVPLLMRWRGVIEPRRIGLTVSTLDVAPTILEAAGVEIPEEFEGHSLLSTARGQMRPGPAVAFSDKLDDRRVATAAGYKLIVRGNLTWSFFNLREDPAEQREIDDGSRHPIALRYLRGLQGQHLGASDRGNWLHAGTSAQSRVLPQNEAQIDAELCRHLQQLGYVDARCDELL